MGFSKLFDQFPVLKSNTIVLRKIAEDDAESLFEIYSNDAVFAFCGIIPKKNVEVVRKMVSHFERDFRKQKRVKWGYAVKQMCQSCSESWKSSTLRERRTRSPSATS